MKGLGEESQQALDFDGCRHLRALRARAANGNGHNIYCSDCRQRIKTGVPHFRADELVRRYNRMAAREVAT